MYKFLTKIISLSICFVLKKTKLYRSFSQEGEDLIIQRILKDNNIKFKDLFYLDIGAGHPLKYSNTFYFYIRGSKGISVDAFEKSISLHRIFRPNDISYNLLLGYNDEINNYYRYKQSELNTMNQNRVKKLESYNIFPTEIKKIKKTNIKNFFDITIGKDLEKINFLNIDIEEGEVELLKKINWNIFKPKLICIEIILDNFEDIYEHESYKILKSNGYKICSKLLNSAIFIKD